MGHFWSGRIGSDVISNQGVHPKYPDQSQASDSVMAERSCKTDLQHFSDVVNTMYNLARERFDRYDALERGFNDMAKVNEQLKAENERLKQTLGDNSEMSHRSHQSSSEDAQSRNKGSEVLRKYRAMDGATRKQAIEAFGKQPSRAELWNRKDLTCRIFLIAYEMAECAKEKFIQKALPSFLHCAPSVGVHHGRNSPAEALKFSEQCVSDEMQFLFSRESFKVASTSILKELAASCDLKDLEKQMITELEKRREQWKKSCPLLPYLEDGILKSPKVMNYIKECVRLAWRMVNLLPPLSIVTVDQIGQRGVKLDDFFDTEVDENKENAQTLRVCVWPAVTDRENPKDVLVKGIVAIIPRPKNLSRAYHSEV